MFWTKLEETSAITLTWYRYSSKIPSFVNYSCMNLCKIIPKYSLWPRFEYLCFRRIWWILVEAKLISSKYSCFHHLWFKVEYLFNFDACNTNKNLINNSKMADYFLIFGRMIFNIRFDIRLEDKYFDLEPSIFCLAYYST